MNREQELQQVNELFNRSDSELYNLLSAYYDVTAKTVSYADIENAYINGGQQGVINLLNYKLQQEDKNLQLIYLPIWAAAGALAAKVYSSKKNFPDNILFNSMSTFGSYEFQSANRDTARYINYSSIGFLVTFLNNNPEATAREIFTEFRSSFGLSEYDYQRVENYRKLLASKNKKALTYALRDVGADAEIKELITSGKILSPSYIDKQVEKYKANLLRYRTEQLAKDGSVRVINQATNALMAQLIETGQIDSFKLHKDWATMGDKKVRHSHRSIPRINGRIPVNVPFRSPLGLIRFPGDPSATLANTSNCRCFLRFTLDA